MLCVKDHILRFVLYLRISARLESVACVNEQGLSHNTHRFAKVFLSNAFNT